ncbi:hypothetical protein, partial [Dyadobacter sp. LHD-138]|uniref:hypothetical protein n=1 Tax=Dyadobacter sp. LHD-138 TaxID=3071413 RepID=UPI0027DEE613
RASAALDKLNSKQKKHLKSKRKIKFESTLTTRQSLDYTPFEAIIVKGFQGFVGSPSFPF